MYKCDLQALATEQSLILHGWLITKKKKNMREADEDWRPRKAYCTLEQPQLVKENKYNVVLLVATNINQQGNNTNNIQMEQRMV